MIVQILSLFVGLHWVLSTTADPSGTLRFVTLGDVGAAGDPQLSTSRALSRIYSTSSISFVALVGDNFYSSGIQNIEDPVVESVFVNAFGDIPVPFHPVLGDNDYGDNGIVGNISAQVALTTILPNWEMPNFFYSKIERTDVVQICTIYIDTQSLISIPDVDKRTPEEVGILETQMNWIETTLSSEECQASHFIVVFGHHPLKSTGKKHMKGKSGPMIEKLTPLFELYKIDAYFSGHDHDLQAIAPIDDLLPGGDIYASLDDPGEESTSAAVQVSPSSMSQSSNPDTSSDLPSHCVSYIVSGASSRLRKNPKEAPIPGHHSWAVRDVYGFTLTEAISSTEMITSFINSETGETVHTHPIRSHLALREM